MKAAITAGSPDELVVTLDAAELEEHVKQRLSDSGLAATLPGVAGGISEGIIGMTEHPQELGEPREIHAVTVNLGRWTTIATVTIPLPNPVRVYA